ncbi:hypothetical protein E2P81_ATG02460 [Venturia nashicola]|nr:hypothetical protein E2P81_ATG02460 [Venturia nashicola]
MFRATIAGTGHVKGRVEAAAAFTVFGHILEPDNTGGPTTGELDTGNLLTALAWKLICRNPDLPLLLAGVYFGRHALCIHVFALEQWRSTGGTSHAQTSPHHDYRIILRARAMSNTKIAIGDVPLASS